MSVPSAIAAWHDSTTQNGTSAFLPSSPVAMSSARITPIVFWASLAPCPRLYAAGGHELHVPETSVEAARPSSTGARSTCTMIMRTKRGGEPGSGASTMNTAIVRRPSQTSTPNPAFATAAPAMPPISACDDDVGSPRKNVMRFQVIAPTSAAKMSPIEITFWSTTSLAIVLATWVPNTKNATKLKNAAHATAKRGESTPSRHDRRDRVGGVVEAVDEVEAERDAARRTTRARVSTGRLGVLQDDALDDVGDVLDRC